MVVPRFLISGQTSAQYFVQATTRSRRPMAARITVALGCKETIRCGVWSEGTINQSYKGWVLDPEKRKALQATSLRRERRSLLRLRFPLTCWQVTILAMYSSQLLDHFEHPRNPGEVVDSDATAQVENPACGDILKLSMKVTNGHIDEIRFLAKGCVPAMACASALTELVKGKTLEGAGRLLREELVEAVGGLPETSMHASHLAMDAITAALKQVSR